MIQQAITKPTLTEHHNQVIELKEKSFHNTLFSNDIVVVDFWAPWCAPCRAFAPIYQAAAEKHPDMIFAKVNVDKEKELAAKYHIRSIPTLIVLWKGAVVSSQSGALSASALDDLLIKAKEVEIIV